MSVKMSQLTSASGRIRGGRRPATPCLCGKCLRTAYWQRWARLRESFWGLL